MLIFCEQKGKCPLFMRDMVFYILKRGIFYAA